MSEGASQLYPTVTGFAISCAIAALRKRNIAVKPLLVRAGLTEQNFDDPRARLPASGQGDFLEYAAEAMHDTAFGLHLAEQTDPRGAGLLFYAASAAHSLGETLGLFFRYASLVNESLRLALASHPEGVTLDFDFVGVSRQRVRQNTEFWIGTMIKASRQITGRHIRPIRVACPHVRNSDLREFERFYGCPVEFNAPTGQLVFSNKTLALPLLTRDPRLLETLRPFFSIAAVHCVGFAHLKSAGAVPHCTRIPAPAAPRIRSAARSAIMIVGALVLPRTTLGITEASTTRKASNPCTLSLLSTTGPIAQVQVGW